jgi:dinuclear metal center YbgI/SA1388 family protein
MTVQKIIDALETIAPLRFATEWDNVGLLVGSRDWPAESVMLTIDLTEPVLNEAVSAGVKMIVAYHPPIFHAVKSFTTDCGSAAVALNAARAGVAIYSPHTALDAAPGGINDWLAHGLLTPDSHADVRALETIADLPESEQCKIVTFAPAGAVDQIRNGLAAVGAGRIGEYQLCSFEISGRGTFLGGESTKPAVGKRGHLEHVDETRLEMVCPQAALGLAVMALRQFHPYEEPPIEIYQLMPRPLRGAGHGRRVVFDQPLSLKTLLQRLKLRLGVKSLLVASGREAPRRYEMIGVCAGAGGSLLEAAIHQGCRAFVTGEMRHHDVLAAQSRGCTVILAGHTNTERGYLRALLRRLNELAPSAEITISKRDADPLRSM